MDDSLCNKCLQFFAGWPAFVKAQTSISVANSRYKTPYHQTLVAWRAAASARCPLCILSLWQFKAVIQRESSQYQIVDLEKVENLNIEMSGWWDEDAWKAINWRIRSEVVVSGEYHDPAFNWSLKFELLDTSESDIPIEPSTGSTSALSLTKKWLDKCTSTHEPCNSEDLNIAVLPTRLLCVSDGQLKLVHTSSLTPKPQYFVLSHCWGDGKILQLLKENLKAFQRAVPEDKLSKTFQDAVYITRQLEYQYIWVDSLCIIQNDTEDWRREASKMSGVYGGAVLSIAASGAKDGSVGCFFTRNDDMLKQIHKYEVQLPIADYTTSKTFTPLDVSNYRDYMENCPLAERGWVFQERFLAPRTVHFTSSQLYFTCRVKTCCETFQNSLVQGHSMRTVERTNISEIWRTVVHNYSQCILKYSTDKLIAISGVAKWLQLRTGDEYIAGMWKSRLELDLLWETMVVSPKPAPNELPTWSWASFDKSVFMPPDRTYGTTFQLLTRVEGIDLDFAGDDTFGEVLRGTLQIVCGPLVVAKISRPSKFEARATYLNGVQSKCSWYNDYEAIPLSSSTWYFLPVVKWPKGDGKDNIKGLMLERAKDGSSGSFQRVGMFSYQPYNGDDFVHALQDPACWAEEGLYDGPAAVDQLGRKRWYINLG